MRFAVSVVTWRQAEIRWPASGCSRSNRSRIAASTGICRSAHSMRRFPSAARARSFTSCLFVVAMCPFSSSGGQQPLMLSLLPLDPAEIVRTGEPVVDGTPQLGLTAQPRREHEVRDLEVEGAPQLGER